MASLNRLVTLLLALSCFSVSGPVSAEEFTLEGWKAQVEKGGSIDQFGRLYLEFLLEENPVSGEQFGIHGIENDTSWYDRRLADVSHEAAAGQSSARKFLLEKLNTIDPGPLSRPDQIDLHILQTQVEQVGNRPIFSRTIVF